MKVIRLLALILLCSQNCLAGPGGTGGGLFKDEQLFFLQMLGEGGHGGGPRLSIEQVNKIDNIEVDNEIRFPKTFKEKCLLLANRKIQTIQLNNREIITISRTLGEGGSSGGPHKILN